MAFSSTKLKNVGGKLLIIKQQITHQKRLQQIYDRTPQHYASSELIRKKNPSCSKLVQHQNYEHHKNIEHLFKFISRKKNMADRLKDPHDFFAYPVYFFREDKPNSHKNKAFERKKKRPIAHSYDNQSEQSQFTRRYGIDVPTVKQMLPTLQKFSQQELEQYAGSIEKIISNYNLQTSEQIDFLKNCVLKTSLPHYPREFGEIVEEIFDDIANSLA